jgi:hypothetical protein
LPSAVDARYAHEYLPGERYAPLAFSVSAALNQQFLFALEDFHPDYLGAPGRPARVHPAVLLHMSARTRSPSFRLAPGTGSVFAKDVVTFSRAARVDEPLVVSFSIRDVYEKRGRIYQALDTVVADASGETVLQREAHSLFFTSSGTALSLPTA